MNCLYLIMISKQFFLHRILKGILTRPNLLWQVTSRGQLSVALSAKSNMVDFEGHAAQKVEHDL